MTRILFVDDEPENLESLKRRLRGTAEDWETEFATAGAPALEALAARPFDVLLTDLRMPSMSGSELLTQVKSRHPKVIRLALSSRTDQEEVVRAVGVTHQFLAKPCEPAALRQAVLRASSLRTLLGNEKLREAISRMSALPSLPSLYAELQQELMSRGSSFASVARIVSKDMGMTAKILQLVNSAFFGLPRRVNTIGEAISLVGMSTLQSLVLSAQAFAEYDPAKFPGLPVKALWENSIAASVTARRFAEIHGASELVCSQAFLAGLLHELGTLILVSSGPSKYQEATALARGERLLRSEAERRVFGCTHADAGAYLLGIWGLSDPIVEAVAYQLRPGDCVDKTFGALTAVHAAHSILGEDAADWGGIPSDSLSESYLQSVGVSSELAAWREACARPPRNPKSF